jgi:tetratricopeptide (TPR) repeat protein
LDAAIPAFRAVIEKFPGSDLAVESYFKISTSYARLQKHGNALGVLDELLWTHPDGDVKDEIYYRKGWVLLELDRWDDARQSFGMIRSQSENRYGLQELWEEMNKPFPPMKNPGVAGALALVPGAGHLYCERYQDALISFVINGAMILAAWEAFDNDNEALGGLLTVFEIGFYSANIYSAANSAHKYNRKQKQDFLENLKKHATVEASAIRIGDSPGLAVTCSIRF